MNDKKLIKRSLIHGIAVFSYIVLIVWLLSNITSWFGEDDRGILAPVLILSIFVISALITGSLVLGKPLMLYLDGKKKDAVKMVFYTGLTILLIVICVFIIFAFTK